MTRRDVRGTSETCVATKDRSLPVVTVLRDPVSLRRRSH